MKDGESDVAVSSILDWSLLLNSNKRKKKEKNNNDE